MKITEQYGLAMIARRDLDLWQTDGRLRRLTTRTDLESGMWMRDQKRSELLLKDTIVSDGKEERGEKEAAGETGSSNLGRNLRG